MTSVILAGDPVFPTFLTKEATAQDYFPEWVVLGYAFTDTAVFGRQYDQKQWAHAFGVSLLPARTADDVDELANLVTWQTGHPPDGEDVPRARAGAAGLLHRRAPRRPASSPPRRSAPASFRFPSAPDHHADAPAPVVGSPRHLEGRRPHRRRRRHRDLVGPERDGHRRGRARDGKGLYRYADDGRRYLPGQWPTTPVGLFDPDDVDDRAHHAAAGRPRRRPTRRRPVA